MKHFNFDSVAGHREVVPPQVVSKWDGHQILKVLHSSGDVHQVAVPEGTDPADLHRALDAAGYDFGQHVSGFGF